MPSLILFPVFDSMKTVKSSGIRRRLLFGSNFSSLHCVERRWVELGSNCGYTEETTLLDRGALGDGGGVLESWVCFVFRWGFPATWL